MKTRIPVLALIPTLCACGTGLQVAEVPRKGDHLATPDGLVVNQWMTYQVDVTWNGQGKDKPELLSVDRLTGVDAQHVLVVNICRQLFASGELTMNLEDAQRFKKVGLTGSPGVLSAATAASKGIDAAKQIEEQDEDEN